MHQSLFASLSAEMLFLDDDETDNSTDLASFQQQNVAYVEMMEGYAQVVSWLFLGLAVSNMVFPCLWCLLWSSLVSWTASIDRP